MYFLKQDNFFEYYNTSAMVPDDVENKSILDIRYGNSSNEKLRYILIIFAMNYWTRDFTHKNGANYVLEKIEFKNFFKFKSVFKTFLN